MMKIVPILNLIPGTSKLNILGITTLTIAVVKDNRKQECAITGRWKLEIEFDTDADGRLTAKVNWPKDLISFAKWQQSPNLIFGNVTPDKIMEAMTIRFKESLTALEPYYKNVKTGLKQTSFVLSGAGYFYMKDPIFTDNADLLVKLTYTGVPVDGKPGTKPQLGVTPVNSVPVPDSINDSSIPMTNKVAMVSMALPRRVVMKLEKAVAVVAIKGYSGISRGSISSGVTMMKLPYDNTFQEVWTGDSGSWVIDDVSGDLYGHIAVGLTDGCAAYIIPAYKIFEDIQRVMGTVELVSSSTQIVQAHKEDKRRKTSSEEVTPQYHPTNKNISVEGGVPLIQHPVSFGDVIQHDNQPATETHGIFEEIVVNTISDSKAVSFGNTHTDIAVDQIRHMNEDSTTYESTTVFRDSNTSAISIALGLNIASTLREMALTLRWLILNYRKWSLVEGQIRYIRLQSWLLSRGGPLLTAGSILWALINILSQIAILMTALTYSFDLDDTTVQYHLGNVSIPDMSHFYHPQLEVAKGNPTWQYEGYIAHMYGESAFNWAVNRSSSKPEASGIYHPNKTMIWLDHSKHVAELNFSDSHFDEMLGFSSSVYTARTLNVTYACESHSVIGGGDGNKLDIVVENLGHLTRAMSKDPGFRSIRDRSLVLHLQYNDWVYDA
ncbi:hypothetical protein G7Y89_g9517 [Cudoniella acicularis]|uniref:Uncharacterized protein n=1 Tax=Cudoniella acicularis TaxID=354080 RepID=A0A8H4VZJ8_9HELO|nr:hypothetical protein G7Y89_g9517 [Cudoniella acicularis]